MSLKVKVKLNDLANIVDCEHKTAPIQEVGIPSIRTPNVGKGHMILDNVNRVSDEVYKKWTKRAIPEYPDLILAREAPVGNVAIIPKGLKVCLGQRTVLIRPKKELINPEYLNYLLNCASMNNLLLALSNGATVGHLNVDDIRKLPLPGLPEMAVQKKIAAILAAYDDLIENNNRRIAILEKMAEEIYKEWFVRMRFPGHEKVRFVKGIPIDWKISQIGEFLELSYGKALKEENRIPGGFPVYGSSGRVGTHKSAIVKGPGIVVGRKGNVGSVHWSDYDFYPIDTVYYVRSKFPVQYLYFLLKTIPFINSDAAVPGLNRKQAYSNKIFLPQEKLIDSYKEKISPLFDKRRRLLNTVETLKQTRDRLLTRLISGKLSVADLDIRFPRSMREESDAELHP